MKRSIFREYIVSMSIVSIVLGAIMLTMGTIWLWFSDVKLGGFTDVIENLQYWNDYLFVVGITLLLIGAWYVYDFIRKRRFLLEEIKTDRRSDLIKKKIELEEAVKKLPSKYEKIYNKKKKELKIK